MEKCDGASVLTGLVCFYSGGQFVQGSVWPSNTSDVFTQPIQTVYFQLLLKFVGHINWSWLCMHHINVLIGVNHLLIRFQFLKSIKDSWQICINQNVVANKHPLQYIHCLCTFSLWMPSSMTHRKLWKVKHVLKQGGDRLFCLNVNKTNFAIHDDDFIVLSILNFPFAFQHLFTGESTWWVKVKTAN